MSVEARPEKLVVPMVARQRSGRVSAGTPAQQRRRLFVPFVGPALLFYTALFVVPTLAAVWISLHEWAGSGPMTWRGLQNYTSLAK